MKRAQAEARDLETIDLGVLGGLVGYHLRRASNAFAADFHAAMAGADMRQVLFAILAVIARHPHIQQGEVGRLLGIQRPNMVSLINELIDRQLVERRTAAKDRRAVALTLTPTGAVTLENCHARIRAHEETMLADISGLERALLIKLLGRIEAKGI